MEAQVEIEVCGAGVQVPGAGGAAALDRLQQRHRPVGRRVHDPRALLVPAALPRQQRDRPALQDLRRPRHAVRSGFHFVPVVTALTEMSY